MTKPTPPQLAPMPCPWGHCAALALPLVHRTSPDDATKIAIVYPMHEVVGRNAWFGRCPGSQLVVAPRLTDAGLGVLRDANAAFVRMLTDRLNAQRARVAELDSAEYGGDAEGPAGGDRPAPPDDDDYFPGRPADAPEPGVGDAPAEKLPLTQIGQPLGRAEDMSTRETHLAMIAAARAAIGEAQEKLAVTLLAIEDVERVVGTLPPTVVAAHGLVHAAVGFGEDVPEPALKMRSNITAAQDTVEGDGSIEQAVALLRNRVQALAAQLSAASDNGESYAAMPK